MKEALGILKSRWEENVQMDVREIGCGMLWTGFISIRLGTGWVGWGCRKHGNKFSGSVKCWEFLVWLSNCWFLKDSIHGVN
jgi:hypothetical protein